MALLGRDEEGLHAAFCWTPQKPNWFFQRAVDFFRDALMVDVPGACSRIKAQGSPRCGG